jgi:putative chitinase
MTRAIEAVRRFAPLAKASYRDAFDSGGLLLQRHETTGPDRVAHSPAQVLHESGGLTFQHESMTYCAGRLMEIYGLGRHSAAITRPEAERLVHDERGIAERVYGRGNPRKVEELGKKVPDDGFRYRGCGLMQTTGRSNFRRMCQLCGVDFEHNPDLVCSAEHVLNPALAEWFEGAECLRRQPRWGSFDEGPVVHAVQRRARQARLSPARKRQLRRRDAERGEGSSRWTALSHIPESRGG